MNKTERGLHYERLAATHLQAQGLRVIAHNYRCPMGEIDLVARDGISLVFVEVRFRRSARYGSAAESIDLRKRDKLVRAAQRYLQQFRHDGPVRFDVVALDGDVLSWHRNAFELTD